MSDQSQLPEKKRLESNATYLAYAAALIGGDIETSRAEFEGLRDRIAGYLLRHRANIVYQF